MSVANRVPGRDGIAIRGDIVNSQDIHALLGECNRDTYSAKRAFVQRPAQNLLQETLSRMTNQHGTPQLMKLANVCKDL